MPTSTTNYGLIKPGTDDPILIGQINDNMDTIDTVLKDHSDKIDAAALGIKFKGEVNYYSNLPNSAEIGDAYTVKYAGSSGTTPDGTEYVWGTVSGTNQWINFSKDSYTKAEVDALLALKQNALSAAQLAAVNSGINSTKVAQIETNENNISLMEEVNGGWNLLNNVATSQTVSPFVITVNSDKSVLVQTTGTISSNSFFEIGYVTLSAGTYVLSGGYSDACRVQDWDGVYKSGANPTTFTLSAATKLRICIRVSNAFSSAEGVLIKPMIVTKALYDKGAINYVPYALSNVELTAAIQALQAQLANQ